MRNPAATYRVQLSPDFPLEDLEGIVNYLGKLGVSTIYAAPFFQARQGSTHGYDITDPFTINREIGNLKTFRHVRELLEKNGMDWLQDIVPNHMAFDGGNPWLKDIFELGPDSRFYHFFDIDWNYKGWKKVMAPFFGGPLEEILENRELKLEVQKSGFFLEYYEQSYPVSARSYPEILKKADANTWVKKFSNFKNEGEDWEDLKASLFRDLQQDPGFNDRLRSAATEISDSPEKLKEILDLQYFLPVHWKHTEEEINYRRFFTINDLICLRMEDDRVFETYHHYIHQLCEQGLVDGLRIDHIDGLFDPKGYTEKLRKLVGKDFYIVVEKILEKEEFLPLEWPVQGTSGYAFLARINHLFTATEGKEAFTEAYEKIHPKDSDYEELVYQKKLFILKERMGGELENLWSLLKDSDLVSTEETDKKQWQEALCALMAAFPVYRIYPDQFPLEEPEKEIIERTFKQAVNKAPERKKQLHTLKDIFLGEAGKDKDKMLFFLQRCQQFTGPLAAKGVEDTSFYIYNRLISHNEVGDSPENFGITVPEFHEEMQKRRQDFPLSVNGSATHDTKRGEDARMRINVLSEIPEEWFAKVEEWRGINRDFLKDRKGPDANEEYFIYQALIGSTPFGGEDREEFLQRTKDYLQKVLREAKVHTNWATPDEEYEQAVFDFIEHLLKDESFRNSFEDFQKKVSALGAIKSLGQVLVKITAPGIPDIYQGTELWDLSYVDPDNRRPINYDLRKKILSEVGSLENKEVSEELKNLKTNFPTGKIKFYCTHITLSERRKHQELFEEGDYLPLKVSGEQADNVIAYARRKGEKWYVVIAPVLVNEIFKKENLQPDRETLKDTFVELPEEAPNSWKNLFTRADFNGVKIELEGLLDEFPVALLTNNETE